MLDTELLSRQGDLYVNSTGTLISMKDVPASVIAHIYVFTRRGYWIAFSRALSAAKYESDYKQFTGEFPPWVPDWARSKAYGEALWCAACHPNRSRS